MSLFSRKLIDFIPQEKLHWVNDVNLEGPSTAFLKKVVSVCEAVDHCINNFPREESGGFTSISEVSYQGLAMSSFALILSHFEKYQRSLFFEIFEVVGFMEGFNDVDLSRRLEKVGCVLSLQRIISGRGDPREVGHIIADALPGWHNPERVNSYYKIFFSELNFYSKAIVTELEMMWQLRHSIVHTAGVVSREDAMRSPELRGLRDKELVFSEGFINEVGRRFHMIVKLSLQQLEQAVRKAITPSLEDPEELIEPLIRFKSPRSIWFEAEA